jgi:hypothetical protein
MLVRKIYGLLAILEPCYLPDLGEVTPLVVDPDGSADRVIYIYLPCDGDEAPSIDNIHERIGTGIVKARPLRHLLLDVARRGFPECWTSQGEKFLFERVREVLGKGMSQPELCWVSVQSYGSDYESFLSCIDLSSYEEVATRYTGYTERRLYFNPDLSITEGDLICLEWQNGNPIPFKMDYDDYDVDRMLQEREDMYILYCAKHDIYLDGLDEQVYVYQEDEYKQS